MRALAEQEMVADGPEGEYFASEERQMSALRKADPEMAQAVANEAMRQQDTIELIASENYVSRAVLEAQGSVLTNKYAEGYPGKRYYGGCIYVDSAERLAIDRAKALFGAAHANVQPHSGSQANAAAYMALVEPGDTVLAMSLAHGGHLTHGSRVNFSGMTYRFIHYGVDRDTEHIDYDALEAQALECKPQLIVAGATAYPRVIDFSRLGGIASRAGALLMADIAHIAGLVASGLHPSPVPHAQVVTSTTHKTLRGPRGGMILCNEEWATRVDRAIFPGSQGGPLMHVVAAKGVAFREAMRPEFKTYQARIIANARALADELLTQGLRLVSGGTDNHLMLVDVSSLGLTGRVAEEVLEQVGIACNMNQIPFDPKPPRVTSGVRLGTPAATTRGFGDDEMRLVGQIIGRVLRHSDDELVLREAREQTLELCRAFPAPR